MKVGLFLTNQQHLDTDMVSALGEQITMVHHARDRGWDSLFSGQHYLNEGNNQQLQIVPFMARLMPEAGEMTTGLGILLLSLHNPVYVAETVATLDVIAKGNFVFGIGLGYRDVEFDAFNVPKGRRVARMVECLELVRRLWTEDSVTHHGETCRLDAVRMNIRPVQRPSPPVWVAANNDRAIRRAAEIGDTWMVNPHSTTATIRRQLALYREAIGAAGKPFPSELPCIKEISAPGTGRPRSTRRGPTSSASTATTRSGARTMRCPTTSRSTRSSRTSCATASSSARPRSATSSSGRHSRSSESTISSSGPTGRECLSRPRSRACGSSPTSCCRS